MKVEFTLEENLVDALKSIVDEDAGWDLSFIFNRGLKLFLDDFENYVERREKEEKAGI